MVVALLAAATCAGVLLIQGLNGNRASEANADMLAAAPELPKCPVMGEAIDFAVKTMTKDGPVYFCCAGCIKKLEKDPKKYAEEVADQRAALAKMERVQVSCPVSGRPVDKKLTAKIDGQTIAFCSETCLTEYEKSPAKFKAKLEDSFTYQARCPITGDKIDPTAYSDLSTGQRIYFCCKNCGPTFLKDPAKYVSKLKEQGVNIDLKKLKSSADKPQG
jgi:YHS domain-containing protein